MDTKFLCDDYNCGDDFYNFVNYNWVKTTLIPDEYQRWGTFQILRENTSNNLEFIIKKSLVSSNTNYQKLGILYSQLIDIKNKNNPSNLWNIQKILADIESCDTIEQLFDEIFKLDLEIGINNIINILIQPCFLNPSINIIHLSSGGLGLPDRSYYLDENKQSIRDEYIKFIREYSLLFNKNIDPEVVFNLEKKLAEKTYTNIQNRNPELQNNLTTWNDLILKCPNLIFIYKLFQITNKTPGTINNVNPTYTQFINEMIGTIPISSWKQYFIFKIILEFSKFLGDDVNKYYFNFFEKVLSGTIKNKSISKQAIEIIDLSLGELLGKLYVENYFNSESKELTITIFNYIKNELNDYLTNNNWMEPITKVKAIEKLNKMNIKIGYPDKYFKNYDKLDISISNSLIKNIFNIKKFNIDYKLKKIYEPVNRYLWNMNPQTVNAYYSPSMNEIVFPAAILQKPIFSLDQDIASNFGSFGMAIGHEITHGFDDQGSKFDSKGRLSDWWTPKDKVKYQELIDIIKKQYAQYSIENHPINSELTLGENIADIGGISLSFKALQTYLRDNPELNIRIDDMIPEKRFFINYAVLWKSKARKEDVIKRLNIDPHSPPEFRVNGVIRNLDQYYEIFNIKPHNKLYLEPNQRAKIWS
jgi:putative endopeptidase